MQERDSDDVELLDAGDERRLERLGGHVVDRPHEAAMYPPRSPERWAEADLRFDPWRGWTGRAAPAQPWPVLVAGLTLELRATASGGVGLYPEHAATVPWLEARIAERPSAPAVLHLFAHTGLLTLAAARAGAAVVHVDAARAAVAAARRNAELSGLADRPVRWIVDDAPAFVRREARRGRRYAGFVLDPPSYGHAEKRTWRIEDDLPELLAACAAIAEPNAFVLLTAHTAGIDGDDLAGVLGAAFPRGGEVDAMPLRLDAASGVRLELGWAARLVG